MNTGTRPHQSDHYSKPSPECPRCQGLLVPTLLSVGPYDATVPSFPAAWRCANCGLLLDLQIMRNRSATLDTSTQSTDRFSHRKARRPRGGPRLRHALVPKG